jgi:hypothetical protein
VSAEEEYKEMVEREREREREREERDNTRK